MHWPESIWYLAADIVCRFHSLIVCIRKNISTGYHCLGLGGSAAAICWVNNFIRCGHLTIESHMAVLANISPADIPCWLQPACKRMWFDQCINYFTWAWYWLECSCCWIGLLFQYIHIRNYRIANTLARTYLIFGCRHKVWMPSSNSMS